MDKAIPMGLRFGDKEALDAYPRGDLPLVEATDAGVCGKVKRTLKSANAGTSLIALLETVYVDKPQAQDHADCPAVPRVEYTIDRDTGGLTGIKITSFRGADKHETTWTKAP